MKIINDVGTIEVKDLYWETEKVRDVAFDVENNFRKAKTEKQKNKWWDELLKILNIQRELEQLMKEVFGT